MNRPLISFVMTVYNRRELLEVCLDTLINSGINDYEIIIVDDASTDETPQCIDGYTIRYPHIRQQRLAQNKGPGCARNVGAKAARGQFLYFIDSDDTIDIVGMPRVMEILRKNPDVDMVAVNYTNVAPAGRKEPWKQLWRGITSEELYTGIDFLDAYPYQIALPLWAFIFGREFFLSCGMEIPETYNMEDMCFTTYALLTAKTIYAAPVSAYEYHVNVPDSLATKGSYQHNLDGFAACCRMFARLPEPDDRYRPHYRYSVRICTLNMVFKTNLDNLHRDLCSCNNNVPEHEPDWNDCRGIDPQEFVLQWIEYFCQSVQSRAAKAGKKICLAPAMRTNVSIARLITQAGCEFAGFLDNNPSSQNPIVWFFQTEGYEVFDMKSVGERSEWFPVLFSHTGELSDILEQQLSEMGLRHGDDFWAVYHR